MLFPALVTAGLLITLFQMPYSSRLMHAMSVMARKDGRIGALNYFDLTYKDAVS